jgi:hypothetical protein
LRNQTQRNCFRSAQAGRGLAEVKFARGTNAFDVPTVRRQVQVGLEDFVFRVMALELERVENLAKFPAERARVEMIPEPRQLHGNSRSPGPRMTRAREVPSRSQKGDRIHAGVLAKVFVFKPNGRVDQRRRNLVERRPDPVLLVPSERNAEDVAISIAHTRGKIDFADQWRLGKRKPNGAERDG